MVKPSVKKFQNMHTPAHARTHTHIETPAVSMRCPRSQGFCDITYAFAPEQPVGGLEGLHVELYRRRAEALVLRSQGLELSVVRRRKRQPGPFLGTTAQHAISRQARKAPLARAAQHSRPTPSVRLRLLDKVPVSLQVFITLTFSMCSILLPIGHLCTTHRRTF